MRCPCREIPHFRRLARQAVCIIRIPKTDIPLCNHKSSGTSPEYPFLSHNPFHNPRASLQYPLRKNSSLPENLPLHSMGCSSLLFVIIPIIFLKCLCILIDICNRHNKNESIQISKNTIFHKTIQYYKIPNVCSQFDFFLLFFCYFCYKCLQTNSI